MATVDIDIKDDVKASKATKKADNLVEIRVPRSPIGEDNYMIVGDNGKYYKLKRGEVVKVPKSVADIIEESETRKEKARDLIESLMN